MKGEAFNFQIPLEIHSFEYFQMVLKDVVFV